MDVPTDPAALRRRQISHDIDHQLATIMLLASLIDTADDVGPVSRQRARQIIGEARWLERLHRAYAEPPSDRAELFRLDLVADEVVEAARLSTSTAIDLEAAESWVRADRLACWRALRNLVGNAVRSAGPAGRVRVGVVGDGTWTVALVDDDGPGFGAASPGTQSLGLGIAHGFATVWDGHLDIRRGTLGGCRARLRLRAATAPGAAAPGLRSEATTEGGAKEAPGARASGASANSSAPGAAAPGLRSEATREGGAKEAPGARASGASANSSAPGPSCAC